MKSLKLYRGITVYENEVDVVIQDIKTNGLYQNDKQQWGGFIWKNIKRDVNTLYNKEDLTQDDTSPASVWIGKKTKKVYKNWQEAPTSEGGGYTEYIEGENSICFADKIGAEYYATKHNVTKVKKIPILITLDLNIEHVAIDGRDFLYTVFGNIDPKDVEKTKRQTKKLQNIFGVKIEKYIKKIIEHPKSDKIAICDLVICDDEIIINHSRNIEIIGGRYGTIFKSAFFGKIPISPEKIQNVEILKEYIQIKSPTITLNDILER
ncbi:MAG: hypothetical protein ACOYMA_13675 [Bacteroidia bacterium]